MPKRLHQADGPPYSAGRHGGWSVGSNGLTAAGQNELLQRIGRQLQADYAPVLNEPTPDRIRELLVMLETSRFPGDDHDDYPDEDDL